MYAFTGGGALATGGVRMATGASALAHTRLETDWGVSRFAGGAGAVPRLVSCAFGIRVLVNDGEDGAAPLV